MFKRSRSKSDKLTTPPKIVFGDLNSAYKSIAQKSSPNTPEEHNHVHRGPPDPVEMSSASSPVRPPQSKASPSTAFLHSRKADTIRISHLSGDLFLPRNLDSPEPNPKAQETWDPFNTSNHPRTSVTTLELKKNALDNYFGVTASISPDTRQKQEQIPRETRTLSASDYPELQNAQLQACSILSGAEKPDQKSDFNLERCATIQSVPTRHQYGRVNTNEDIRSIHGAHELNQDGKSSEPALRDEIQQVEWTPRSSEEVQAFANMQAQGPHPGAPPSIALPETPLGKGAVRYRIEDPSSPSEQISSSSASYGNTQRLLQVSLPQLPGTPVPRNNLYHQLVQFARDGQSSSSQGNSSMSFAEFSIEEANGVQITRPISQGEFQQLQRTISSHRRHESRMSDETSGNSLVRVGQISFRFPETSSEVDFGPGSSQTASTKSEVQVDWETGSVQVPLRTRNGTPPLLFGGLSRMKSENDWETVGESNELTESIADISDTASGSPLKSFPSLRPGQVLRHPAHPRYNHSWDLQQDVRSGAFVLTPRYVQLPGGNSFPNQNALEPLALRGGPNNYSHPTPLTGSHSHPFVAPPIAIAPAEVARLHEFDQRMEMANTQDQLQPQGSSAWLSTAGGSFSYAPTTVAGGDNAKATAPVPPVPRKNPSRRWKQRVSKESLVGSRSFNFGFHSNKSKLDQVSSMEEGSIAEPSTTPISSIRHGALVPVAAASAPPASTLGPPSSSIPPRSPLRKPGAESKATKDRSQHQSNNEDHVLNPFNDHTYHISSANGSASPVMDISASPLAFPEDTFSPGRRGRTGPPMAPQTFITTEQAKYIRSQTPDWAPTNLEMHAIISPLAAARDRRILPVPSSPISPRLWKPTPHPLAHLGPREESPHLWHLHAKPPRRRRRRPSSHQQVVSRYYLGVCFLLPVLLVPYFLGGLDWVMRVHTRGVYRGMAGFEKKLAVLFFCVWILVGVAFVPLIFSLV
ncbi:MAG: hypothetical protein Q9213_004845 [Squamulea squamosa]